MACFTSSSTCRLSGWIKACVPALLLLTAACTKKDELPFPKVPSIRIEQVSHDTIVQYRDVLTITFSYRDGDGDLGYEDPDRYAIFIRDARLENFDGFYLGPLAPEGVSVPVQGKLNIEFPSLFLFGNGATESTRFYVKIVDRAGNESNLAETQTVVIRRE